MRIEIRPTSAEFMSAAEAGVVSGTGDIGGALGRSSLRRKFRPALGAGFSGLIIDRLTLATPFQVQRPATIVAELGTLRVGMVAEGASAGRKNHGQHLNGKTHQGQIGSGKFRCFRSKGMEDI